MEPELEERSIVVVVATTDMRATGSTSAEAGQPRTIVQAVRIVPPERTPESGMAGKATGEPPANVDESKVPIGKQVPVTSILSPDDIDKTYVWIIDGQSKQVTKREVTTGKLTNTGIMITDGLEAGEWIAIAGVHYLREGMEVRILQEKAE